MKVILVKDVEGHGFTGDIIEVKDGFANNYLIPRGLALPATKGNVKHIEDILAQKRRKIEREKELARKTAEKIDGLVLEIKKQAGEGGKLFGAVTAAEVVGALKEKGIEEVNRKNIVFPHSIKEVGVYTIKVRLHKDIFAEIKIDVKSEKSS